MDYLKIYNTLDSTNKEAQRLLAAGPVPDGLALLARQQTEGRGQLGRIWVAEPGNHLAMTIIHQASFLPVSELPVLGLKVSLGIVRAVKALEASLDPMIKWPNDIYIREKKLCGILIENSLSGGRVQHSIIGIGVNINETRFPADLHHAISLRMITGKEYEVEGIARKIREEVMFALREHSQTWKNEYDQYVFGKGQIFLFESGSTSFQAMVSGVTMEGKLILQMNDGTFDSFSTHEVKWMVKGG